MKSNSVILLSYLQGIVFMVLQLWIVTTEVLQGRPHGGVVIIYPDSLGSTANNIKTVSKRLCAISLQIHCISLYLFCVYMPVDCNNVNNLQEFKNILSEISMICLNNNAGYVCITKDMSTDLSRTNSWHTKGWICC